MSNKEKGDNYELQIKNYIINILKKPAYLWHETPETILIECGIIGSHNENRLKRKENKTNPLTDTGIDIIQIESYNTCSLVQCKNGYNNGLTIQDLAGFHFWMAQFDKLDGYAYYTHKLSHHIEYQRPSTRIKYIKQPYITEIKQIETKTTLLEPYSYQKEADKCFLENFKKRGILSMPCGTGKTFTSFMISKRYKQIILLSPLKQSAKQNMDKYIEMGYPCNNALLVDSDGERDPEQIKNFVENNENFLISATFCSIDIIYKTLEFMNQPLIIVDEFHNISKNNVTNEDDDFYKVLYSEHKMIFMSATPRVYELEGEDDFISDIFGDIIYNMSFSEAIEQKYITDYKLWLPSIHEDDNRINQELNIYKINTIIKAKCKFLYISILNTGIRKCIVYCVDTKEIQKMMKAMNILNDFYCIDVDMSQITCNCNEKTRNNVLENFAKNTNIQLLFSVRILDECIDIPSCDSIYITYPSKSKTRNIQRMNRATRNDKKNPFKIANIFVWCEEYDEILTTLSGIKEHDPLFKDKINIIESNYFGDSKKALFQKDVKDLNEKYLVGIKEYRQSTFDEILKEVDDFIQDNKKLPMKSSKNKDEKKLSAWVDQQKANSKNEKHNMKDVNREKWKEFVKKHQDLFISREEHWLSHCEKVDKFIIQYDRLPRYLKGSDKSPRYSKGSDKSPRYSKGSDKSPMYSKNNDEQILGAWVDHQKTFYKKREHILKYENIRKKWEELVNNHQELFMSSKLTSSGSKRPMKNIG